MSWEGYRKHANTTHKVKTSRLSHTHTTSHPQNKALLAICKTTIEIVKQCVLIGTMWWQRIHVVDSASQGCQPILGSGPLLTSQDRLHYTHLV